MLHNLVKADDHQQVSPCPMLVTINLDVGRSMPSRFLRGAPLIVLLHFNDCAIQSHFIWDDLLEHVTCQLAAFLPLFDAFGCTEAAKLLHRLWTDQLV